MARILGLFPAALNAVREGLSANAFYSALKSEGIAPRRAEALQLYKMSKAISSQSGEEPYRPVGSAPSGNEISPWPSKSATGVRQNVTILYRDRVTGQISRTYYAHRSQGGVTREEAMATAIGAYQDHAESYNQDLIGAVHTSTYEYLPINDTEI